jgi:hypothetical protein
MIRAGSTLIKWPTLSGLRLEHYMRSANSRYLYNWLRLCGRNRTASCVQSNQLAKAPVPDERNTLAVYPLFIPVHRQIQQLSSVPLSVLAPSPHLCCPDRATAVVRYEIRTVPPEGAKGGYSKYTDRDTVVSFAHGQSVEWSDDTHRSRVAIETPRWHPDLSKTCAQCMINKHMHPSR